MKTKRLLSLIFMVVLLAAMAGCKAVTTGSFSKNVYTNDYFGMTFTVPKEWIVVSKDDMKQIFQASAEMFGSDNKEAEKTMKLAEQKTLYLAYVLKHPLGYPDGINANINVVSENLGLMGLAVRSSKDYAQAALQQMERTLTGSQGYTYSFGAISDRQINGKEFSVFNATLTAGGLSLSQRMYCTLKNNYAIAVTISWYEEGDLAELESIVETISFK